MLALATACDPAPVVVGAPADVAALEARVQPLGPETSGAVVVAGTVGEVCQQGCWFYLVDERSLLFVKLDLASGLVVPRDSGGRRVLVAGRIEGEGAARMLVGETVVLR